MTILIITDSLGFPRLTPEAVLYEKTYVAMLKKAFPTCDFIHQGQIGATISELYTHSVNYFGTTDLDLVFVQAGIVDCAPRALKKTEQAIVNKMPLISQFLIKIIKKNSEFLRKTRKITYTDLTAFRKYINLFEEKFTGIHWIGIVPASDEYEQYLSNVKINIEQYNTVLKERNYVSVEDFDKTDVMSDFHHFSLSGHQKMFERMATIIKQRLDKSPILS
jgi:hypothetical protein